MISDFIKANKEFSCYPFPMIYRVMLILNEMDMLKIPEGEVVEDGVDSAQFESPWTAGR